MGLVRFKDRIYQYRAERKLTQEDIANKLGVTKAAVGHWESGRSSPKLNDLHDIAEKLGVSEEWMFGFDGIDKNETAIDLGRKKYELNRIVDQAPTRDVGGIEYPVINQDQLNQGKELIIEAMKLYRDGLLTKDEYMDMIKLGR